MVNIVVLGAGLGGAIMAYEMKEMAGPGDRVTVITKGTHYSFVPSNPWVAVGWRKREDIEADLVAAFARRDIALRSEGARRVDPHANRIELNNGDIVDYDYLIIATGPDLAFDEIPGFGPEGHTQSICTVDHALKAQEAFKALVANPGPVIIGAAQGASCFGPAYEFAFVLDKALRDARVRDRVPLAFVTPEPYVGHLGLDGVGDTKGLLESELRQHHIKWVTNAKVRQVDAGKMTVDEVDDAGQPRQTHEIPFVFSMMLPAFRGVEAIRGIEGLVNPRGFVIVDDYQRNPAFPNVFAVVVCVAIPPQGKTAVPCGVPKTGFMIESMVTATAHNIAALLKGQAPHEIASWNAVCLADFGDGGIAFVAQPQLPPRNVNWSSSGRWVHLAKIAFEKYFLRKIRIGKSEPFYEKITMRALGIDKLRATRRT